MGTARDSRGRRVALAWALGLLLAGCLDTPSAPQTATPAPATSTIFPSFSAQSDGKNIRVYASQPGSFDFEWGGLLTATAGGRTEDLLDQLLPPDASAYAPLYSTATLPQPPGTADVVIAFLRPTGEVSAPRSTITLAAPFQLAGSPPATFRRGDALPIELTPLRSPLPADQGRVSIAFEGACLADPFTDYEYPLVTDLPFTGSATFDTSVVAFVNESDAGPFECDVTIHVRAETIGVIDPAFGVGAYEGLQEQTAPSHITR
jgi:hypothetical protein